LRKLLLLFPFFCQAQISTITLWKDSAMGAIWNKTTATVAYGKKDANGYYKIYLSDSLGNNEKPLQFSGWKNDRHQWAEEWYPNGKYLFCYIEKADYEPEKGHKRAAIDAVPGYGAYTDLWLVTRDGKQAWQLTNLPNNYNSGIIHSAISDDGKMFAWSERIKAPKFLNLSQAAGSYVFKVADFSLDSVPHFSNMKTFQPGDKLAANELESISKDKTTLAFYSTYETKNLFATPIYTLNMITGEIKRLTFESFAQAPTYTPDGKHLIYMTGRDCTIFPFEVQGADWWIMNTDGTEQERLTFMNKRNHPQSVNHYRLAGCISFMSDNSFLGGVMTKPLGLTGKTVKVTFDLNKK
jgi:Tol biopolymer transport system component